MYRLMLLFGCLIMGACPQPAAQREARAAQKAPNTSDAKGSERQQFKAPPRATHDVPAGEDDALEDDALEDDEPEDDELEDNGLENDELEDNEWEDDRLPGHPLPE